MATISLNQEQLAVVLRQKEGRWQGQVDGQWRELSWRRLTEHELLLTVDGVETAVSVVEHNGIYHVHGYGRSWQIKVNNPITDAEASGGESANAAIAPMPGTVVSIGVQAGDSVAKGAIMLTIESMKMLTDITANRDGVIEAVHLETGDTFDKGALLVTLEEERA